MSLRGMVPPDPQTSVSQERYAVIFTPRTDRKRYPAGCVEIFDTVEAALAAADLEPGRANPWRLDPSALAWLEEQRPRHADPRTPWDR